MSLILPHVVSNPIRRVLNSLACPDCRNGLAWEQDYLTCRSCGRLYPIIEEIADLRSEKSHENAEAGVWLEHWSEVHQQGLSQQFFSFYRKAVFARTVQYFLDSYFPYSGIFLEAGSGTSETSMRIDKCRGARVLVAIDLILPILFKCHPVMDVRLCGDIFRLPFRENSIDGIWNVGVMEHFTHSQIDEIMCEFHRIMKDGARIVLLWPATNSIPQKMLRISERFINLTSKRATFRFHPEEISQLRSAEEGCEVLHRNGFHALAIDNGFRSMMAFKTLVGEKKRRVKRSK